MIIASAAVATGARPDSRCSSVRGLGRVRPGCGAFDPSAIQLREAREPRVDASVSNAAAAWRKSAGSTRHRVDADDRRVDRRSCR
jgi:hypothetical protein